MGGLWMDDEVDISPKDYKSREESSEVESRDEAISEKNDRVRHTKPDCRSEHVRMESHSTGGFGTSTKYTDYCTNCGQRSEPYTYTK